MFVKHQKISFGTSHSWDLFAKTLVEEGKKEEIVSYSSLHDQAKAELLDNLHLPQGSFQENSLLGKSSGEIKSQTSLVETDKRTIGFFNANISYDFLKAEMRRKEKLMLSSTPGRLSEPWSDPTAHTGLTLAGFSLENQTSYSIYYHLIRTQTFKLRLPEVFKTVVGLEYSIADDPQLTETGTFLSRRTTEQKFIVETSLLPRFVLGYVFSRKNIDALAGEVSAKPDYQTAIAASYLSDSDCWRLSFKREKSYGQNEKDASYYLQLTALFVGTERSQDFGAAVKKYLSDK